MTSAARDDTDLCYPSSTGNLVQVPTDSEVTFADHAGRLYARRYGMAPMVGRLLGYLAICDPPAQSIAELAQALLASRSAIASAINALETLDLIRRSRAAGERMDRVRIDMTGPRSMGFDVTEYLEQGDLAREGLALLAEESPATAGGAAGVGRVRRLPGGAATGPGAGLEGPPRGVARRRRTPRQSTGSLRARKL